jgi:aryl-alcohol dehydrogenase-like predicted oxidoreductase
VARAVRGMGRKYLPANLDQSLERIGRDHVDIFHSHRPDRGILLRKPWALSIPRSARAGRCTPVDHSLAAVADVESRDSELQG